MPTNHYYQQRWNSQDLDDTPIVADLLPPVRTNNYGKHCTICLALRKCSTKTYYSAVEQGVCKFQ